MVGNKPDRLLEIGSSSALVAHLDVCKPTSRIRNRVLWVKSDCFAVTSNRGLVIAEAGLSTGEPCIGIGIVLVQAQRLAIILDAALDIPSLLPGNGAHIIGNRIDGIQADGL